MNFIVLYERLSQERDKRIPGTLTYVNELQFYQKLLNIAFENGDELPNKFYIYKVHLSKAEVENILNKIELNATVNVLNNSYDSGSIYEIVLQ